MASNKDKSTEDSTVNNNDLSFDSEECNLYYSVLSYKIECGDQNKTLKMNLWDVDFFITPKLMKKFCNKSIDSEKFLFVVMNVDGVIVFGEPSEEFPYVPSKTTLKDYFNYKFEKYFLTMKHRNEDKIDLWKAYNQIYIAEILLPDSKDGKAIKIAYTLHSYFNNDDKNNKSLNVYQKHERSFFYTWKEYSNALILYHLEKFFRLINSCRVIDQETKKSLVRLGDFCQYIKNRITVKPERSYYYINENPFYESLKIQ